MVYGTRRPSENVKLNPGSFLSILHQVVKSVTNWLSIVQIDIVHLLSTCRCSCYCSCSRSCYSSAYCHCYFIVLVFLLVFVLVFLGCCSFRFMFLLVETTVSTQWLRPSDVEGRHCWWRGSKSCVVRRNGQKHGPTKLLSTWSRWCVYVLVECSRSKKSWRWKCWYTGRCCCNCFLFFLKFRRVLRSIHVRTILWLEMGHRNALYHSLLENMPRNA